MLVVIMSSCDNVVKNDLHKTKIPLKTTWQSDYYDNNKYSPILPVNMKPIRLEYINSISVEKPNKRNRTLRYFKYLILEDIVILYNTNSIYFFNINDLNTIGMISYKRALNNYINTILFLNSRLIVCREYSIEIYSYPTLSKIKKYKIKRNNKRKYLTLINLHPFKGSYPIIDYKFCINNNNLFYINEEEFCYINLKDNKKTAYPINEIFSRELINIYMDFEINSMEDNFYFISDKQIKVFQKLEKENINQDDFSSNFRLIHEFNNNINSFGKNDLNINFFYIFNVISNNEFLFKANFFNENKKSLDKLIEYKQGYYNELFESPFGFIFANYMDHLAIKYSVNINQNKLKYINLKNKLSWEREIRLDAEFICFYNNILIMKTRKHIIFINTETGETDYKRKINDNNINCRKILNSFAYKNYLFLITLSKENNEYNINLMKYKIIFNE